MDLGSNAIHSFRKPFRDSLPLLLVLEVAAVARTPVFLRRRLEATDLQTCEEAMFDHNSQATAASAQAH